MMMTKDQIQKIEEVKNNSPWWQKKEKLEQNKNPIFNLLNLFIKYSFRFIGLLIIFILQQNL